MREQHSSVQALPRYVKELLAGGVAGALGKTSVAPLERAKILLQTGKCEHTRVDYVLMDMYRSDGMAGMFRGNMASVARVVPYAAIHFAFYENIRRWLATGLLSASQQEQVPPWVDLLAGAFSGAAASVATYPLDLIRTRLAWEVEAGWEGTRSRSLVQALQLVVREQGMLGLYKGITPTIAGIMPYAGLKFYVYQVMKSVWRECTGATGKAPIEVTLIAGGVSGLIAQTVTYPLDLVRRRMQVTGADPSMPNMSMTRHFVDIVSKQGWLGLFRGVTVNYVKVVPATAVGFTVYDHMKRLLALENSL